MTRFPTHVWWFRLPGISLFSVNQICKWRTVKKLLKIQLIFWVFGLITITLVMTVYNMYYWKRVWTWLVNSKYSHMSQYLKLVHICAIPSCNVILDKLLGFIYLQFKTFYIHFIFQKLDALSIVSARFQKKRIVLDQKPIVLKVIVLIGQ